MTRPFSYIPGFSTITFPLFFPTTFPLFSSLTSIPGPLHSRFHYIPAFPPPLAFPPTQPPTPAMLSSAITRRHVGTCSEHQNQKCVYADEERART